MINYSDELDERLMNFGTFEGAINLLPSKKYFEATNYVSSTELKYIYKKSAQHYHHKYILKAEPPTPPSPEMQLGSLFHSMALTPDLTNKEYFIKPDVDGRTKDGKAQMQDAIQEAQGRTLVSQNVWLTATNMVDSLMNHKKASTLIVGCQTEVSFFWKCPFSQIGFKSRIDALADDYFIELKSTKDASQFAFDRQAKNLGYDISLSHYTKGLDAIEKKDFRPEFIAVESDPPHTVQLFKVTDEYLTLAHNKWLEAVDRLSRGFDSDVWPGYSTEEEPYITLHPSKWEMANLLTQSGDE